MRRLSARGQVVVEILLILPVFLFLVFSIMEIGYLSFRTILIHHAAYEVARIGSLTAFGQGQLCGGPGGGASNLSLAEGKMKSVLQQMLPTANLVPAPYTQGTLSDPQSGCQNEDLVVTVQQAVPLIFPGTGFFLGRPCANGCNGRPSPASVRCICGTVRMPIEKPLFQ